MLLPRLEGNGEKTPPPVIPVPDHVPPAGVPIKDTLDPPAHKIRSAPADGTGVELTVKSTVAEDVHPF